MTKPIRELTNREILKELETLNTKEFKKIKSRVTSLQAEIKAREEMHIFI